MAQASGCSLILLVVLNIRSVLGAIGSGAIAAALILIVVSFVFGYVLAGPGGDTKPRLGPGNGAAQRVGGALVVGAQNFDATGVLVIILVWALMTLVILMVAAGEFGRRTQAEPE